MYILNSRDKIAIVSLSGGILGEKFCSHQLHLGIARLKNMKLEPIFMKNSLKGIKYIGKNKEARVEDLINAFKDESIKAILCAIGGVDGVEIIPYILENEEYVNIIKNNPKIFIGYSDSTHHHLLLYKLGIKSFYGISFLTDFAELDEEMLRYTKDSFFNLFLEQDMKYTPSKTWQEERKDFSRFSLKTSRVEHIEDKGYMLLQGKSKFSGKLFGGCVESLNELLCNWRFEYKEINDEYELFPKTEKLKDFILFLETSELKISKEELKNFLIRLEERGIFDVISGMIFGKPQDEVNFYEYIDAIKEVCQKYDISIAYNFNFGHAYPKMLMQYGKMAHVDIDNQTFIIER